MENEYKNMADDNSVFPASFINHMAVGGTAMYRRKKRIPSAE
jgi:hypothetical protein